MYYIHFLCLNIIRNNKYVQIKCKNLFSFFNNMYYLCIFKKVEKIVKHIFICFINFNFFKIINKKNDISYFSL